MKVFFQYLLMVSIPIVAVFGLIQLGKDLKAPISVGGAWALDTSPPVEVTGACENALMWPEPPRLTITQSGRFISLAFNDAYHTILEGTVDGTELSGATTKTSSKVPGLQLNANIDRQVEPDRMLINLKVRGCNEPIALVGTRLPHIQGAGSH